MSRDWLRPALSCIFSPATSFPRSWVWHFLTRNGCSFPVETYTGASVPRSTLALGRPRVCVTKFHSGTGKIWRGEPFLVFDKLRRLCETLWRNNYEDYFEIHGSNSQCYADDSHLFLSALNGNKVSTSYCVKPSVRRVCPFDER